MNRLQENLERGGVSDFHRDRRGQAAVGAGVARHRLQGQPEQGAVGSGGTIGQRRTAAATEAWR